MVLPMTTFPTLNYYTDYVTGVNQSVSVAVNTSLSCSALYEVPVDQTDVIQLILDFFMGTVSCFNSVIYIIGHINFKLVL